MKFSEIVDDLAKGGRYKMKVWDDDAYIVSEEGYFKVYPGGTIFTLGPHDVGCEWEKWHKPLSFEYVLDGLHRGHLYRRHSWRPGVFISMIEDENERLAVRFYENVWDLNELAWQENPIANTIGEFDLLSTDWVKYAEHDPSAKFPYKLI